MSIIDDLVAHPGLYLGIDNVQDSDVRGAARMVVTPLPGNVGVSLDYEILNPNFGDGERRAAAASDEGGAVGAGAGADPSLVVVQQARGRSRRA